MGNNCSCSPKEPIRTTTPETVTFDPCWRPSAGLFITCHRRKRATDSNIIKVLAGIQKSNKVNGITTANINQLSYQMANANHFSSERNAFFQDPNSLVDFKAPTNLYLSSR